MELSIGNVESIFGVIESIAIVAALVGVWVAYRQWKDQKSDRHILYMKDFSSSVMENPDMSAFIHMIERDGCIGFKNGTFETPEKERIVDFALCRLSNYVALKESKSIDVKDYQFIDYILKHSLENYEVKAYLNFLLRVVQGDSDAHPYKQLLEHDTECNYKKLKLLPPQKKEKI